MNYSRATAAASGSVSRIERSRRAETRDADAIVGVAADSARPNGCDRPPSRSMTMNFSGCDDEPSSRLSGVASIPWRFDLISHDCSFRSHPVSSDRAMPWLAIPQTPSGTPSRALTRLSARHANCFSYQMDAYEIQAEGFAAVAHCTPLSFIEAIRLREFSRIEVESGSPGSAWVEGIVREPTRRDSKCVPQ